MIKELGWNQDSASSNEICILKSYEILMDLTICNRVPASAGTPIGSASCGTIRNARENLEEILK